MSMKQPFLELNRILEALRMQDLRPALEYVFVPYRRLHFYQTLDLTPCTVTGGPWQIGSVFWTSTAAWSSSCIVCTLSACSVGESLTKWRPCSMPGIFSPLPLNTREVRLYWLRRNGMKTSTFCLTSENNFELVIEIQIFWFIHSLIFYWPNQSIKR